MDLLINQRENNQPEEPNEETTPKKETEEDFDAYEYDYNKRLWF